VSVAISNTTAIAIIYPKIGSTVSKRPILSF
jgi:hypothetical protein